MALSLRRRAPHGFHRSNSLLLPIQRSPSAPRANAVAIRKGIPLSSPKQTTSSEALTRHSGPRWSVWCGRVRANHTPLLVFEDAHNRTACPSAHSRRDERAYGVDMGTKEVQTLMWTHARLKNWLMVETI
jgi:hypothetical protein